MVHGILFPFGSYVVGDPVMQVLAIRETEVQDLHRYLGTLSSRGGGSPDETFLVLDISRMGLLLFCRMGKLKAAQCDFLWGCKLVKGTEWMDATHVLLQRRDAFPLDQAAKWLFCTFTDALRGGREAIRDTLTVCSTSIVHRFSDVIYVKLGCSFLRICCLPNNRDLNAPIFKSGWRDCNVFVNRV